ncbi:MAG: hypothetical protein IPO27_12845 [Bacteroidetes bacterium]|nr:hypothetical protein [Bacteroidota bacterium]
MAVKDTKSAKPKVDTKSKEKEEVKVVPAKTVKKPEPIKVSKNLKYQSKPSDFLKAIPKDEIKPFTRTDKQNFGTKEKLQALYYLQQLHSHIDNIRIIRGELPMEVNDLSDEIAGLQTRITNLSAEVESLQDQIARRKGAIKDSQAAIKKYESQQSNVKNNREYESLSKEIEFQTLEIELCEKRIREHTFELNKQIEAMNASNDELADRMKSLETKKNELDSIIAETQKEEEKFNEEIVKAEKLIEHHLLTHYTRIRKSMTNGLGVVSIQRDSCGGCFNKIPPQIQLDIAQSKKITICEHCGRLLVPANIMED